ncbi:unnamed protein product [Enterobius vermicularis]|uniref:Fibronectin type-III domain-containing protein n=1 Tax=Enterobius vermicularis TaxID=51028 RepID=A0A158QAC2_ENTVE|nr:unnamed protein product [Enterobius vermicularis]
MAANGNKTYHVYIQAISSSGPGITSDMLEVPFIEEEIPLEVYIELLENYVNNSSDIIELDPGEKVTFKCSAFGSPSPTLAYFWSNGTSLESQERKIIENLNETRLYMWESSILTEYIYESQELFCEAKNVLEVKNARASFVVKKPGVAPSNLRSSISNTTEATLEWDEVQFGGEIITEYRVYISQNRSGEMEKWQTFNVQGTKLDLFRKEVIPSSIYYFKVSAVNKFGEGIRSKEAKFVTGSGAPRDPPKVLESEETNNNVLVLLWKKPKYTIYYTKDLRLSDDDYKNWNSVEVLSNCSSCSYKMTQEKVGMRKDEDYRYRITAWNDVAESKPTNVKFFATLGKGEYCKRYWRRQNWNALLPLSDCISNTLEQYLNKAAVTKQ